MSNGTRKWTQAQKNKFSRIRLGTWKDVKRRFWSKVNKRGPYPKKKWLGRCWIWKGAGIRYGHLTLKKKDVSSHVFSLKLVGRKIPKGFQVDHLCSVPKCVRPSHLEAVPRRINVFRSNNFIGLNMRKTHCPKKHSLSYGNLVVRLWKLGRRSCLTCTRKKARDAARAKAAANAL